LIKIENILKKYTIARSSSGRSCHPRLRTPSSTLTAEYWDHRPYTVADCPTTSSLGGLCPSSSHSITFFKSASSSCSSPQPLISGGSTAWHCRPMWGGSSTLQASALAKWWHSNRQGHRDNPSTLVWLGPARRWMVNWNAWSCLIQQALPFIECQEAAQGYIVGPDGKWHPTEVMLEMLFCRVYHCMELPAGHAVVSLWRCSYSRLPHALPRMWAVQAPLPGPLSWPPYPGWTGSSDLGRLGQGPHIALPWKYSRQPLAPDPTRRFKIQDSRSLIVTYTYKICNTVFTAKGAPFFRMRNVSIRQADENGWMDGWIDQAG